MVSPADMRTSFERPNAGMGGVSFANRMLPMRDARAATPSSANRYCTTRPMARSLARPTLGGMTSRTPSASAAAAFQQAGQAHRVRLYPAWFQLLVLGLHVLAASVLHSLSYRRRGAASQPTAVNDLDEVDWRWTSPAKNERPTPGDWVFPSFFLCMAVVALPLVGTRWTTPESMATWSAFADALVFSLPIIVPLPFLFLGCLGMLALQPASRTPTAIGFLGAAVLMGLAGMHALFVPL